ncbi:MAG: DciA family protein [Alphaproteobacteria bacterium]|nr:DciA family protein [Alphaproteobacteria bacterium]
MKEKKEIVSDDRRTGDLSDMIGFLEPFARKMLGKKAFAEADVLSRWTDIVGDETASYSKPIKIDFKKDERTNGSLVVETDGGAFALELQLKSNVIIERVNTFFGYEAISRLKIIQNPKVKIEPKTPTHNFEKTLVTKEEENYIKVLSEGVLNQDLQQSLQKLGRSVVNNNKIKR